MARIFMLQFKCTICIDGSASASTKNGGAAAVIVTCYPIQPIIIDTFRINGRLYTYTSSYEEEIDFLQYALLSTSTNVNNVTSAIFIWSNSQSLCKALISSNSPINYIRQNFFTIASSIFIQRFSGHPNMPRNGLGNQENLLQSYQM